MKRVAIAIGILLAGSAVACLWDYDTLAEEAEGNMDFVRVITGRFDRNPPLYFQMRLDRVAKELQKDPSKLDDYDNAAVACDRLSNDEEAVKWIEKKRAYMTSHGLTPKTNPDDWYRYYANAGTFHAHLWFRHGAKSANIAEIKKGRDLIAKALEINPESHFGRERVQLMVMDWAIEGRSKTLADYLELKEDHNTGDAAKDAKGLAGLVQLGNAWESVDTFAALQSRLSMARDGSLAHFAELRAQELIDHGAKSLSSVDAKNLLQYSRSHPMTSVESFNEGEFKRLRKEADAWQAHREEFMLARLKEGRHPDTDPQFWTGYTEKPAPEVRGQAFFTTPKFGNALLIAAMLGVLFLLVGCPILIGIYFVRRSRRRRQSLS